MTYYDDDEDPGGPEPVYDTEALLRRAIDIIATARTIPLSSSPMINRDEIIEILEEALHRMPEELRQARWMLKERQAFIDKTRREAEDILDAARAQSERMVQRQEVVRQADMRARQIVELAEADARKMRLETEDFCDQRLASFEIVLDRLQRVVAVGREKLAGRAAEPAPAPSAEPAGNAFFDQDAL
jgi:cell division septum initiation protein DivIVA